MKTSTQSPFLQKLGRAGTAPPHSQRGVVMVMVTIAMAVLIGMSGLALDMGHAYWNKTRLQNALDAAALSGAKTLDQFPGDLVRAELDAKNTFSLTAAGDGNQELNSKVSGSDVNVQFYATLVPLQPPVQAGNVDARYVRVSVNNFDKSTWFVHVLPGVSDTLTVGGSAVAGPSPTLGVVCNVAPMMICGDPADTTYDPAAGDNTLFGYTTGQEYALKISDNTASGVGSGNFHLINLDGSKGGSDLRDNMAGSHEACLSNAQQVGIDTKTGKNIGPVFQGLNTRWGDYNGPPALQANYPADEMNTCEGYSYAGYINSYSSGNSCTGSWDKAGSNRAPGRRVVSVPVGDCSTTINGTSSNVPMMGFSCFFLTQRANQGGDQKVYGEFIGDECNAKGVAGPNPVTGPGPYKIQLYQDPLSADS